MVVDCSHLMVVVEECVEKEPHWDVVELPLIAPINGQVAEMQAAVDLQAQLLPRGSSRSEGILTCGGSWKWRLIHGMEFR